MSGYQNIFGSRSPCMYQEHKFIVFKGQYLLYYETVQRTQRDFYEQPVFFDTNIDVTENHYV